MRAKTLKHKRTRSIHKKNALIRILIYYRQKTSFNDDTMFEFLNLVLHNMHIASGQYM